MQWNGDKRCRWLNGCYFKYCLGSCNNESCKFLHDLTPEEGREYVANVHRSSHKVFENSSNSNSFNSTSSQSGADFGGGFGDGSSAARNSTDFPSLGSAKHESGTCKPCMFAGTDEGCMLGKDCRFCHILDEHHIRRKKLRPCKGKRDRFRSLLSKCALGIERNPYTFDLSEVSLPPFLANDAALLSKFKEQLEEIREETISDQRTRGASSMPLMAADGDAASASGAGALDARAAAGIPKSIVVL